MQFSVLKANGRTLSRGCAVLMLAGVAAGCSSQASRFNGVDDVFTSSTNNQRAIIDKQSTAQPYPGDVAAAPIAAAPVDGSHSQSVSRSSLEPVTVQQLPPPSQPAAAPAPPPHVDRTMTTATVQPARPFKNADEPYAPKPAAGTPHATEIVVRD